MDTTKFLSTPSARRATGTLQSVLTDLKFLSTPSARRATLIQTSSLALEFYFYPRPPRGGRRSSSWLCGWYSFISIHALREEGDQLDDGSGFDIFNISIHALREEGDQSLISSPMESMKFLSTPSARRATSNFSCFSRDNVISIHALREEGDFRAV